MNTDCAPALSRTPMRNIAPAPSNGRCSGDANQALGHERQIPLRFVLRDDRPDRS